LVGLVPAVNVFIARLSKDVDARRTAGHDERNQKYLILLAAF
jgi:hypothetical protein